MPAAKPRSFRSLLQADPLSLGWTIARLPFDPAALWPELVHNRVCGDVNGVPFRTALFADPLAETKRGFYILVTKATQRAAGLAPGDTADVQLAPDLEPRPAELPDELDALLDDAKGLRPWYNALSEYTRREIGKWIGGVKAPQARLRRAEQMAERLLSTMEAETELPPALERAFRTNPQARQGWQRMTAAQRRGELFAVFYYQTPEAREKRILKLLEAAAERAS